MIRVGATSRSPTPAWAGDAKPARAASPRSVSEDLRIHRVMSGDPPLCSIMERSPFSLVRNGYFSVNHAGLPAAFGRLLVIDGDVEAARVSAGRSARAQRDRAADV